MLRLNCSGQTVIEDWTVKTPRGWGSKGNRACFEKGILFYCDRKLGKLILASSNMESRKCAPEPGSDGVGNRPWPPLAPSRKMPVDP